jgi:hypothetical protein
MNSFDLGRTFVTTVFLRPRALGFLGPVARILRGGFDGLSGVLVGAARFFTAGLVYSGSIPNCPSLASENLLQAPFALPRGGFA